MTTKRFLIYCDGSIYPNPGGACGWGFTATDMETGEVHEEYGGRGAAPGNSNNRVEMAALIYALRWLNARTALIMSDSQYVVTGTNEWSLAWEKAGWTRKRQGVREPVPNADLWKKVRELRFPSWQEVQWIRGHNGTAGNERADALALLGRQSVEGCDATTYTHVKVDPSHTRAAVAA